jgi:hypothetical protein
MRMRVDGYGVHEVTISLGQECRRCCVLDSGRTPRLSIEPGTRWVIDFSATICVRLTCVHEARRACAIMTIARQRTETECWSNRNLTSMRKLLGAVDGGSQNPRASPVSLYANQNKTSIRTGRDWIRKGHQRLLLLPRFLSRWYSMIALSSVSMSWILWAWGPWHQPSTKQKYSLPASHPP